MILLNEHYTEWSFSVKTNEKDGKSTIVSRPNQINFVKVNNTGKKKYET